LARGKPKSQTFCGLLKTKEIALEKYQKIEAWILLLGLNLQQQKKLKAWHSNQVKYPKP